MLWNVLSIERIKFKLRRGDTQFSHNRVTYIIWRSHLIESGRDAMASDDDVEMAEADLSRFSTAEKGKAKATEPPLREEDNSLPWCVNPFPTFGRFLTRIHYSRVEKYRPVTMEDVVSHKDIISTSMFLSSIVEPVTNSRAIFQSRNSSKRTGYHISSFMALLGRGKRQLFWPLPVAYTDQVTRSRSWRCYRFPEVSINF